MVEFEKMWTGKDEGLPSKLKESLKPKTEIRKKIGLAVRELDRQSRKLDSAWTSLGQKDHRFYERVVKALRNHDRKRAILYANELAEIRKTMRSISQARLALEQISLRLNTVQDIGDIVATLAPAMSVIRSVRGNLSTIIPKADKEFDGLSDMLGSILIDASQTSGLTLNFSAANVEAEKILKDAETQVEVEMREKLPSVPSAEREGLRL
ncbi:MAG: Snf7 family protein [Candidatus Geothermarchaeales archaeon]